jgi:hypothetical protein
MVGVLYASVWVAQLTVGVLYASAWVAQLTVGILYASAWVAQLMVGVIYASSWVAQLMVGVLYAFAWVAQFRNNTKVEINIKLKFTQSEPDGHKFDIKRDQLATQKVLKGRAVCIVAFGFLFPFHANTSYAPVGRLHIYSLPFRIAQAAKSTYSVR